MKVSDFDYDLPPEFIAQSPASPRDSSRLLHLDRATGRIGHFRFTDIVRLLNPKDVLVMNNTRVIPARLAARKAATGGKVEILLLRRLTATRWKTLIRGRNIREGLRLELDEGSISCQCIRGLGRGQHVIEFDRAIDERLQGLGEIPLPPYIQSRSAAAKRSVLLTQKCKPSRSLSDAVYINNTLEESEKYQTVYSAVDGSAAAPTAGLHFTPELMTNLQNFGVKLAYCTLHIGLDTFQPVAVDDVSEHVIHSEFASLDAEAAGIINGAIASGQRVIAVGTTSARTLESAARARNRDENTIQDHNSFDSGKTLVAPMSGDTDLFIVPGFNWRVVDAMITNFHLPRSTLLMMLSAFAGREAILDAYEIAKEEAYRFYSFGDAMFVT
ncbi:MAG: S-adenosylmethionine:tRNA ribosyltransferase-isomerase [Chloroflexota bacterium]|nr:S-adenosylmethionine:tRNA ribosyltransferase-isomerase [Chloroflexota bacterium]